LPHSFLARRRPAILLLAASALALTLSPLASRPAAAQDAARMDQVIRASSDADAFSGAVLVARDGRILLDQGYGLANREWNIPNDGDVKFRLGSLSKQFTAVAVMLLNQQGKLDLDAPIKTWLSDAPAAWDAITPRHLLSHTAGVPNFTAFSDFEAQKTRPATLPQLIARFRDRPLDSAPGSRFAYSNSGYVLLSAIIEAASGQTYADFVSGYDRHDVILPRRASGYAPGADGVVNADYVDMTIPTGAGALYSTTHDLLKWEQGLFGERLLNAQSMTALTTPVRNGYAMGLMVSEADGKRLVWHNGAIEGFNTYMAYDPGDRTAVIVLGNLNGEAPDKLGAALVTLARGGTVTLPSERRAVALSPEVLKAYEGVYNLAPTFALTISVVDGKLMAQATGQPAFALTAEAEDAFYLTAVDAQITFTRNAAGAVEGLVLHQGGRDMPAKRQ